MKTDTAAFPPSPNCPSPAGSASATPQSPSPRGFVKSAAAASPAFGFQFVPSSVWGANSRVNFGAIGTGGKGKADIGGAVGAGMHCAALVDLVDIVDVERFSQADAPRRGRSRLDSILEAREKFADARFYTCRRGQLQGMARRHRGEGPRGWNGKSMARRLLRPGKSIAKRPTAAGRRRCGRNPKTQLNLTDFVDSRTLATMIKKETCAQRILWKFIFFAVFLTGCGKADSESKPARGSNDPFGGGSDGLIVGTRSNADHARLNRQELEAELRKLTIPSIELENEDFAIAIDFVISRGTELSSLAPIDFPYEIKFSSSKLEKVSVKKSFVPYIDLLDYLCEQAGMAWRVKGREDGKGTILFEAKP